MSWEGIVKLYRRRHVLVRRQLLLPIEWLITHCSRDGHRTFFDSESFPWIAGMESHWSLVRAELDQLLKRREAIPNFQDVSENQKYLTQGEQWKTFILYFYGRRIAENCASCPQTERLLKDIPGMKTAMFSILAPGKHIPAHFGPYKGVLRYHLGLIVPRPESLCRIRVGNDVRSWSEGRSLVFDDRHSHEVWNDSDAYRTVLFVDFVRPLPWPLSLVNRIAIKGMSMTWFVRDAVKRARKAARDRSPSLPHAGVSTKRPSDLEEVELS